MNNFIHLLSIFVIGISSAFGLNHHFYQQANVVVLDGQKGKLPLGPYLEILRDETGEITINDLVSEKYEEEFISNRADTPNFGFQTVPYWVRFRVENLSNENTFVLALNFANMQFLDVYTVSPDTMAYTVKQGGIERPYEDRDYALNIHAVDLVLPQGEEQIIYIHFRNQAAMTLPLTLWAPKAFANQTFFNQFALGTFYGIMIIMILYSLILWVFIRAPSYLYLTLFSFWVSVLYFFSDGLAAQFINLRLDRVSSKMILIAIGLALYFMLRFVDSVLEIKDRNPWLHKVNKYIAVFLLLITLLAVIMPYSIAAPVGISIAALFFFYIFIISIYFSLRKLPTAKYMLVSLIFLIFGVIFFALNRLGIISNTFLTEYATRFGLAWMVIFWLITLAEKVKNMESDVRSANLELIENQERLEQYLEAMPVGVNVYDKNMKLQFMNKTAEDLMINPDDGFTRDQLLGQSLGEVIKSTSILKAGTQRTHLIEETAVYEALKGKQAYADNFEVDLGERKVLLEAWANPIIDSAKHIDGAIVAFQNITREREFENSLRRSEERFRFFVETMNEGLGVIDQNFSLVYVNPNLEKLLGYSEGEMLERKIHEFVVEDHQEKIKQQLDSVKSGINQVSSITWYRVDGEFFHSQLSLAGVYGEDGTFQSAIFIVTDISEQIQISELLEKRVMERTHELTSLLEVSKRISGTLELEPLLELVFNTLNSVINFSGASFFGLEGTLADVYAYPERKFRQIPSQMKNSLKQRILQNHKFKSNDVIINSDIHDDHKDFIDCEDCLSALHTLSPKDIHAWMCVPLKIYDRLIGVFNFYHQDPDYFQPSMIAFAQALASQAVIAIENAGLYQAAKDFATLQERNRLSRELHDSVTQSLYSSMLFAEAGRLALSGGKTEVAETHLSEVITFSREAMRELRLLIFELRPSVLEEQGFIGAMLYRLESVEKRSGWKTDYHIQGEANLSRERETELYWAVHEALNNVLKHSRASEVYLDIKFTKESCTIIIRDNGVGFDAKNLGLTAGLGMKTISERIKRINGSLSIESSYGKGTFLKIVVSNN